MTVSQADRAKSWKPSPRPEWLRRINEEGECMDIGGVVPLDEASLLNTAMSRTGLSDFGDPGWYEPFKVLINSLETESNLNLMGRLMTRSDLLIFLEARLRIEDTYKKHPEIEDQEIVQPLLIVGQARSGTSFLQNLLSADPDNGSLLTWEVLFPYPPPEKDSYLTDPRIEQADRLMQQYNRVVPEMAAMHEFSGKVPTESVHLDCLGFVSAGWFNQLGQVPSYNAYVAKLSWEPVYQYEKRVLKFLQWKNPRKRWILKTPHYIYKMPDLAIVFPDACLIWPHRDPVKASSSLVSLLGTHTWARSDQPLSESGFFYKASGATHKAAVLNQAIEWLKAGVFPSNQVCNIQYGDLIDNPVAVVEQIYSQFGIAFSDKGKMALNQYMAQHPRSSRPTHIYDMGNQDLVSEERQAYKRYQEFFGVRSEV